MAQLQDRLERLLREAAKVDVEPPRADGTVTGVSHYSLIEGLARDLGKRLSREVQDCGVGEGGESRGFLVGRLGVVFQRVQGVKPRLGHDAVGKTPRRLVGLLQTWLAAISDQLAAGHSGTSTGSLPVRQAAGLGRLREKLRQIQVLRRNHGVTPFPPRLRRPLSSTPGRYRQARIE